jgi:hypothetical protein
MRNDFSVKMWLCVALTVMTIGGAVSPTRVPYDPETMHFAVSLEEAIQIARDWTGDQSLSLEVHRVYFSDEGEPITYYLGDQDTQQVFDINCNTGWLSRWQNADLLNAYDDKVMNSWDKATQLSAAQLIALKSAFLLLKYPGFQSLNMQPVLSDDARSAYVQELPNGVHNFKNGVQCAIDEWSGDIYGYSAWADGPPTISTDYTINQTQAEQIATDYCGTLDIVTDEHDAYGDFIYIHPQSVFVIRDFGVCVVADDLEMERLVWMIDMAMDRDAGYTPEDYGNEVGSPPCTPGCESIRLLVDANTGEVTDGGPAATAGRGASMSKASAAKTKSRRPNPSALKSQPPYTRGALRFDGREISDPLYPPLSVDGTGYLYAKYLPLAYGGTIEWNRGTVNLVVGERHITIHPGSPKLEIGGATLVMPRPPMIIACRTYLPYESIEQICGASVTWDTKTKVMGVTSGNAKPKSKTRPSPVQTPAKAK